MVALSFADNQAISPAGCCKRYAKENMPPILKSWLKTILLPHLCTLLLMVLIILPHTMTMLRHGEIGLPEAFAMLLAQLPLWLLCATLGWYGVLIFPNVPPEYTIAVLSAIAAMLIAGYLKRHSATGRCLVSLALWLWTAYGFLMLGLQG